MASKLRRSWLSGAVIAVAAGLTTLTPAFADTSSNVPSPLLRNSELPFACR